MADRYGTEAEGRALTFDMAVARVLRDGDSFECAARAFGLDVGELKAAYAKDRRVLEAAVLSAAEEWRDAEKAAEDANFAWTENPNLEADRKLEAAFRVKSEKLLALRSAADALSRARRDGEGGPRG